MTSSGFDQWYVSLSTNQTTPVTKPTLIVVCVCVSFLQLQLKQAIRLGSPPSLMCVKKMEDAGTTSEDDGLPCSPPEYTTPQAAMVTHLSELRLHSVRQVEAAATLTGVFFSSSFSETDSQQQRQSGGSRGRRWPGKEAKILISSVRFCR